MNKMSQVFVMLVALMVGSIAPTAFADETPPNASIVVTAVNINTATAKEIAVGLKGVGIKKAQAVVAYREQNGPFKTAGEITDVKGIGKGILQRNGDRIVVE